MSRVKNGEPTTFMPRQVPGGQNPVRLQFIKPGRAAGWCVLMALVWTVAALLVLNHPMFNRHESQPLPAIKKGP